MRTGLRQAAVVATATTVGFSALAMGATAHAKPLPIAPYQYKTITCKSKKGDQGWVRFKHKRGSTTWILKHEAKFKLKSGKKTKNNNVEVKHQHGVKIISADNKVANNKWATLWPYSAKHGKRGKVTVKFVFDYPKADDPRCTASATW